MSDTAPLDRKDKSQPILQAAASVFLTHGFSAATTDMIQREAKVSKATVYACFPNKEALFAAVIERECAVMAETVRAIEPVPGNIAETLTNLGLAYLKIVLSPTGLALFRVVVADAPRFPELARKFYLAGPKTINKMIVEQLETAARKAEINLQATDIEDAAIMFASLLRGQGQLESLTHPETVPSLAQMDRWVRIAVVTFLAAFGNRNPFTSSH